MRRQHDGEHPHKGYRTHVPTFAEHSLAGRNCMAYNQSDIAAVRIWLYQLSSGVAESIWHAFSHQEFTSPITTPVNQGNGGPAWAR